MQRQVIAKWSCGCGACEGVLYGYPMVVCACQCSDCGSFDDKFLLPNKDKAPIQGKLITQAHGIPRAKTGGANLAIFHPNDVEVTKWDKIKVFRHKETGDRGIMVCMDCYTHFGELGHSLMCSPNYNLLPDWMRAQYPPKVLADINGKDVPDTLETFGVTKNGDEHPDVPGLKLYDSGEPYFKEILPVPFCGCPLCCCCPGTRCGIVWGMCGFNEIQGEYLQKNVPIKCKEWPLWDDEPGASTPLK